MAMKRKQVCESSVIPGGMHRVTVQATVITTGPGGTDSQSPLKTVDA